MASGEVALVEPKNSITTLPGELALSHETDNTPGVTSIPVSMVVHGGTGVLHGNMTSLTVNQYIGMVPDQRGRDVWDSDRVRELVADAVKISVDANTQLFQPSDRVSKSAPSGKLGKVLSTATHSQFL